MTIEEQAEASAFPNTFREGARAQLEALSFVEYVHEDGSPLGWFVEATDAEHDLIQSWLLDHHDNQGDDPLVIRVKPIPFAEFKRDYIDPDNEDEEGDDDAADPAG